MSPRERNLAIIVGAMAVLLVGWFLQKGISGSFQKRKVQLADLESKLSTQRLAAMQSAAAARRKNEYEARSLPSEAPLARSLYQRWLLEKVQQANIDKPLVSSVSTREEGKTLTRHQFNVSGRARLDSIVKLLFEIHKADTLHRISRLTVRPVKDSKDLDLQMSVEAIALSTAPPDGKLTTEISPRLAGRKVEEFLGPIEQRNLFGPANRPPQIASARPTVQTNRSADFSVKANDPDKLDKVTYRLLDAADKDASIDPASGRFKWTPRKPGTYEFVVEAMDDGIPAKKSQETIRVAVSDPPPPPAPEPKKLAFDDAKFTVLTGIVAVGEESEVWLLVRPKGKTVRLQTGDKFEIGSIQGEVASIDVDSFSFVANGKVHRLDKGAILQDASVESSISAEAPNLPKDVN